MNKILIMNIFTSIFTNLTKMENKILTFALVKLFDNLYTSWYADSSCEGECFYNRYTYITDKYTILYDPSVKGFGNSDLVNNKILITIKINDGEEEITQENLSISLNKIEEAINRDLFLIRKYFCPCASYTYGCFDSQNWKTKFKIIDNQTLSVIIKPYWFEDIETMKYSAYHLLLIGNQKEDIDKDEYEYEYEYEKDACSQRDSQCNFDTENNLSYEQKIRKEFIESQCLDNIDLNKPITIYTGEHISWNTLDEETESKFTKEKINIDEIFEKELEYYESKKHIENNEVDVNYIEHLSERISFIDGSDASNSSDNDD